MAKTQKILGLVLFFLLIVAIAPVNSEEGTKDKLFLKSGKIIECDKAWIGVNPIDCTKCDRVLDRIITLEREKGSCHEIQKVHPGF